MHPALSFISVFTTHQLAMPLRMSAMCHDGHLHPPHVMKGICLPMPLLLLVEGHLLANAPFFACCSDLKYVPKQGAMIFKTVFERFERCMTQKNRTRRFFIRIP